MLILFNDVERSRDAAVARVRSRVSNMLDLLSAVEYLIVLNEMVLRFTAITTEIDGLVFAESPTSIARAQSTVSLNLGVLVRQALEFQDNVLRADIGRTLAETVSAMNDDSGAFVLAQRANRLSERVTAETSETARQFSKLKSLSDDIVLLAAAIAEVAAADARQALEAGRRLVIFLTGLSVIGAVLIVWIYINRNVIRRLNELIGATQSLAAGDLTTDVPVRGDDELADMGRALAIFKSNAVHLRDRESELERSNRALEQFAYLASHDLKEPLRAVGSYCDLIKFKYSDRLDDDGKMFIDYAVGGARRMRSLIDDLLKYSRIGRDETDAVPVDLNDCFDDACLSIRTLVLENEATINAGQMPNVLGNSTLLTRVFQNLFVNAIKFRTEAAPRIDVSCKKTTDGWNVSVIDNGIGIEPEFCERVFRIFQQLHSREEYPGNGLGLALCQRIVEQHGGTISIEPSKGTGTKVTFKLPMQVADDQSLDEAA